MLFRNMAIQSSYLLARSNNATSLQSTLALMRPERGVHFPPNIFGARIDQSTHCGAFVVPKNLAALLQHI